MKIPQIEFESFVQEVIKMQKTWYKCIRNAQNTQIVQEVAYNTKINQQDFHRENREKRSKFCKRNEQTASYRTTQTRYII